MAAQEDPKSSHLEELCGDNTPHLLFSLREGRCRGREKRRKDKAAGRGQNRRATVAG